MSSTKPKARVRKLYRNCVKECRMRALVSTQMELAKMTGISFVTISLYESQKTFPSAEYAILIAYALGCSLDELFKKR